MEPQTTSQVSSSSPIWERLATFVREQGQRFIQAWLEEEITALLGRPKSAQRGAVDAPPGMAEWLRQTPLAESDERHDHGASVAGAGAA